MNCFMILSGMADEQLITNRDKLIAYFEDDRKKALHRWVIDGESRDRNFALISSARVITVLEAENAILDKPYSGTLRLDLIEL
ncbi:MAG: hypothetical protein WAV41_06130 [Microgenomates group bacterium]